MNTNKKQTNKIKKKLTNKRIIQTKKGQNKHENKQANK